MKKLLGSALLTAMLLTGGTAFGQISLGVRIGPPPAPRVLRVVPRRPGPDYVWVEGYWYPKASGRGYSWHQGYWTLPPYFGARWIPPRYDGNMFYNGYWEGGRGRMDHDHRSDRDRNRDLGNDRYYRNDNGRR